MHATTVPPHQTGTRDRFPLSRRELAVIVAVWSAWAVLSLASRLFDRELRSPAHVGGSIAVVVVEALCWALLTPPIVVLADRFDPDRPRAWQIGRFALVGLAAAVALGWLGSELRITLTPMGGPPPRPPVGPPNAPGVLGAPRGGPPVWFGMLNAMVLYLGVLAAGFARSYARRYALRRELAAQREAVLQAQLVEARLDALRRQLDPHFLFNTLNAVSALVERDPRGVRRMIARLSDLLRHSFESHGAAEVPLRDELALLGRYVDIMQVRFQGRLTVETRADDDVLDAAVPAMILQPLVENAIKHGVERATGPGRVEIEAWADGRTLVLRVRDDGPGIVARASSERPGVGVRNTVARLAQLYGDEQRFSLTSGESGGARAEIRLPLHTAPCGAPRAHATDAGAAHVA